MFAVVRAHADDLVRVRALRFRALMDSPDAFGMTLEQERDLADERWLSTLNSDRSAVFLAVTDTGDDCGMVFGIPHWNDDHDVALVGMWVDGARRGTAVAASLVEALVSWASEYGYRDMFLDVADDNARAVAFYDRLGFTPTGRAGTLAAPREHITEHERVRHLQRAD